MKSRAGVYILNKSFEGSWNEIEGNISHEIIDFVRTDEGKYFVYNVPYGCCPEWIHVKSDKENGKETHDAEYLLLTGKSHNGSFSVQYRIKLLKKLHSFSYHYKDVKEKEKVRSAMEKLYDEYHVFYGGRKISEILDTDTPLITFEADYIEKTVEPIEIKPAHYNYQRNKGYLKEDEYPDDYNRLKNLLEKNKWVKVGLSNVNLNSINTYDNKTFLDLIMKPGSEECYTNMLYSILKQPGIMRRFCQKFATDRVLNNDSELRVFREHNLVGGRVDICAENDSQRIVIENKLFSGLNGIKQDECSQLSTYYSWGMDAPNPPICFLVAPDFRIRSSHSGRLGDIEREIKKYDPDMVGKYILVTYGEIADFIDESKEVIGEDYEYFRYLDDMSKAFKNHAYQSKSEYYQELFRKRLT